MDGRKLKRILFILCTLVAQNLSFADSYIPHIEYKSSEVIAGQGYVLNVIERKPVDSKWQVELIRMGSATPDGFLEQSTRNFFNFLGAAVGIDGSRRVYYLLRVQMIPADEDVWAPKAVHLDFDYFVSGYPAVPKSLNSVSLNSYIYFYASSVSLLTPTLQKIKITPDERAGSVKIRPTLASSKDF